MTRLRSAFFVLLAAAATSLATPAASPAVPPPVKVTVDGGEESWHPDNGFLLELRENPDREAHCLVRDSGGRVVVREEEFWNDLRINLPEQPGVYTAEVWLSEGAVAGPRTNVLLRFDNVPPAAARPLPSPGWIQGAATAAVQIGSAQLQPVSGIRGFAVSIDRFPGRSPCVSVDRCTVAETDLLSGAAGGPLSLGRLPQGINYAHIVAVSGSGMRSEAVEDVELRVDGELPQVALSGAPQGWSNRPLRLTATATDSQSGMAPDGPAGPFTAIAVDGGVPSVAAGGSVAAVVRGDGAHRVEFYARDAAGNVADGQAFSAPPASATVWIDEGSPRVAFSKSQDPAEPERIEAAVSDPLSGPNRAQGSIAVRPEGSQRPFEPIPTTVTAGRLSALWDSDAYRPGGYEFRATGYDAAGNQTSTERRTDGARMVLANPLKKTVALEFGFGAKQLVWHRCARARGQLRCHRHLIEAFDPRPARRSVPAGRGVPVGGRLASQTGSPLGGVPVEIVETFEPGAAATRRVTTVQTAPDGSFLAHLPPGPSREVQVGFSGSRLLSRASGRRLKLGVRTAIRMRASSGNATIGGGPVVFSGEVGHFEAAIPSTGRPVELQFRLPGSTWSEFRTVQTDAQGRFRYPYSFSDDDSRGVRFEFRAVAPSQPGWPYEPGISRPVAVTGR
ncbi:MAG: hypothetical protein H0X42_02135 [Solirubrobacterales bacterium]|nr:hypothetical protein [Solirubrobacterales bacterium]